MNASGLILHAARFAALLVPLSMNAPLAAQRLTVREVGESVSPTTRVVVPDATAISAATKLVDELYQKQLSNKSTENQEAVARQMIDSGMGQIVDAPGRYALFQRAREVAITSGGFNIANEAIDAAAKYFVVDTFALRADAIIQCGKKPAAVGKLATIVLKGCELIPIGIKESRFDELNTLHRELEEIAKRSEDRLAISTVAKARTRIDSAAKDYSDYQAAMATLSFVPENAAANLSAGLYACSILEDWAAGLAMLAKGSDPKLRDVAGRDLAANKSAQQIAAADAWFSLGDTSNPRVRRVARSRAFAQYKSLHSEASGLEKSVIEKRIAELQSDSLFEDSDSPMATARYKRVILVCDTTGSMMEILPTVRNQLDTIVAGLVPGQTFNILAFSEAETFSFSPKPIAASAQAIQAAREWIVALTARGSTDPRAAFRLAFQQQPDVIYVFTDGFENSSVSDALLREVQQFNKTQHVVIHGVLVRSSLNEGIHELMKQLTAEAGGELFVIER